MGVKTTMYFFSHHKNTMPTRCKTLFNFNCQTRDSINECLSSPGNRRVSQSCKVRVNEPEAKAIIGADLLDLMRLADPAHRLDRRRTGLVLEDELPREAAGLNFFENTLHFLLGLCGHDARATRSRTRWRMARASVQPKPAC